MAGNIPGAHTQAVKANHFLFQLLGNDYLPLGQNDRFETAGTVPTALQVEFTGNTFYPLGGFAIASVGYSAGFFFLKMSLQFSFQRRF